jgi:hypothetical protein
LISISYGIKPHHTHFSTGSVLDNHILNHHGDGLIGNMMMMMIMVMASADYQDIIPT